ncbi:hypothetical protein J6590_086669 [Homalodisca vitripennis]|nr:hypothetical protein J6590_078408 [Homalodisca vitripennis]KAG8324674.1 hypothetical protein J6590_086669 [Homalodisca vitripennis]
MPLILYYLEASPPARSVDLVINALGLSAEHRVVNLFEKAHLSPDYVKGAVLMTKPDAKGKFCSNVKCEVVGLRRSLEAVLAGLTDLSSCHRNTCGEGRLRYQ